MINNKKTWMKRALKDHIILYKRDMIEIFNVRTKQSKQIAYVLDLLIKSNLITNF